MQIMVWADDATKEEFENKKLDDSIKVIFIKSSAEIIKNDDIAALFIFKEKINLEEIKDFGSKPVFINSTLHILKALSLPGNWSRFNGWPTFVNREVWEIATAREDDVRNIFEKLGWKFIIVADEPGLVSARIISMIINEAYFALGENVSSKDEIDKAMKLGTNYPYGPFEWSKKIGLKKIFSLLKKLSETDDSYVPAPEMKNELSIH